MGKKTILYVEKWVLQERNTPIVVTAMGGGTDNNQLKVAAEQMVVTVELTMATETATATERVTETATTLMPTPMLMLTPMTVH